MSLETVRSFFLWCTIINFGILLVWSFAILFARDLIYRLNSRWFQITREQFDLAHYVGIAVLKIGIILLNLVPFIALCITA
jgi:hypothetical protein